MTIIKQIAESVGISRAVQPEYLKKFRKNP